MRTKIFTLLLCCCFTISLSGQAKPSIQFQSGINFNKFAFDKEYVEPYSTEFLQGRKNLGYSFGLLGELPISFQQSLIVGLASTRINNYPELDYGLWYGLVVDNDDGPVYLGPSYLERLQFDLIDVSLSWRYYFTKQTKVRPYLGIGTTTSFSWRERERWKSMLNQEQFANSEQLNEYEATDHDFRHFRTTLTLNLGSTFRINDRLSFVIDLQSNIIEHRQAQVSKVTKWVPSYWEIEMAYLNQFSMNVGLQRNF